MLFKTISLESSAVLLMGVVEEAAMASCCARLWPRRLPRLKLESDRWLLTGEAMSTSWLGSWREAGRLFRLGLAPSPARPARCFSSKAI